MTLHGQAERPKSPPVRNWTEYWEECTEDDEGIRSLIRGTNWEWPTLVIGSGCTTNDSQFASLDTLAQQLAHRAVLRPAPSDVDGRPMYQVVWRFIDTLIADRARRPEREDGAGEYILEDARRSDETDLWPWLLDLVVAAALLTKLYHRTRALNYDAPRRPDHEEAATLSPSSLSWVRLDRAYIQPCLEALGSIDAAVVAADLSNGNPSSQNAVKKTVEGLLEGWKGVLSPPTAQSVRVRLLDVQALAEFVWFCLTAKAVEKSLYPGWSDMLLDLSNYDSCDAKTGGGRVGVPLFTNVNSAANLIRDRYWSITKESLGSSNGLFQTVASLLNAQDRLRGVLSGSPEMPRKKPGEPPIAAAFVTSFDVELELALLGEGRPFAVAFPINVVVREPDRHYRVIKTCWLALQVPGENDDSAADPTHAPAVPNGTPQQRLENIHLPSSHLSVYTENTQIQGPLVVHLAGCPLVILPELNSEGGRELQTQIRGICHQELDSLASSRARASQDAGTSEANLTDALDELQSGMKLWHAIILNEYDAMVQNSLDLLPSEVGYGLPSRVARGGQKWNRFWMLLGVQIRDNAIRQRIATLVSSLPHNGPGEPPDSVSVTGTGVAVNSHVTELDEDLLFWSGFDVVKDDVTQTEELLSNLARQCDRWTREWGEPRA
jgi:hypothetical protein